MGGFCKFWFIPVEDVAVFPRVNPTNQKLVDEPMLFEGKSWFGPIDVPKDRLGFSEDFDRTKAGPYYKIKLDASQIGESAESRANMENLPYHRYLVVGKLRAGGMYVLIGSLDSFCQFTPDFKAGTAPTDNVITGYSFTTEHISKAYILPSFGSATQVPGIGGDTGSGGTGGGTGGGTTTMANNKEIIPFSNQLLVQVPWTQTRLDKFGNFPVVEVWIDDGSEPPYMNMGASIEVDAPPPAFTELKVNVGLGQASGFIVIT